ncbi:MAG: beta-aspartyl-peptidase [Duodenibacillus sp.]
MALLIKNADVYAPEHLGVQDVLTAGETILAIGRDLTPNIPGLETIDAKGHMLVPGFFDQHVHVTGGGGEAGPVSRTPEIMLSSLIKVGTTNVVGVSGTDFVTRSIPNLLAKVRALAVEGLSTWMYTSNYHFPPTTLSGSVADDMLLVPELLGVKIALGDHRSSFPTLQDVLHLLADIRLGGMICGKKGLLHIHLGDIPGPFEMFAEMAAMGFPAYRHVLPTHCSRKDTVFAASVAFVKAGGRADYTTGGGCYLPRPADAVAAAIDMGANASRLTFSTDGQGSMPRFNDKGEMIGLGVGGCEGNLEAVKDLINVHKMAPEQALTFITTNVAEGLGISGYGRVKTGFRANLNILDDAFDVATCVSRGRVMMLDKELLVKGTFEL